MSTYNPFPTHVGLKESGIDPAAYFQTPPVPSDEEKPSGVFEALKRAGGDFVENVAIDAGAAGLWRAARNPGALRAMATTAGARQGAAALGNMALRNLRLTPQFMAAQGIGSGVYDGFKTPTSQYYARLGLNPNGEGNLAKDLLVRTGGVSSDVAAGMFDLVGQGDLLRNQFRDLQRGE